MEKQGMDRRRQPRRPGLLTFFFLLALLRGFSPPELSAEDELSPPPPPEVRLSSRTPALRSPWTVTILVDHPVPGEVRVRPPPFPEALALEQVRTALRAVRDNEGVERRLTAIDFVFIPRTAGNISLGPFEVESPRGTARTAEIRVQIPGQAPAARARFRWTALPPSLTAGERVELRLTVEPPAAFSGLPPGYPPEAPENGILEVLPPEEKDQAGGLVLRLAVIPLGGKELVIPPFRFTQEGRELEIPALRLPLRAPPAAAPRPPGAQGALPEPEAEPSPASPAAPPPFPEIPGEYRRAAEKAKELWERGLRGEALAEIRRNEREDPSGPALRPLRREMERRLGIEDGEDEPWRPRKILLLILPGDLILMVLLTGGRMLRLRSSRKTENGVTLSSSRWYTGIMAVLLAALVPVILILGAWTLLQERDGTGPAVVREETAVYRIPDRGGAVEARLGEGRRVRIRAAAASWVRLESPDGLTGWASRDAVIFY